MSSSVADALAINRLYYKTQAKEFCRKTGELALDDVYRPFLKLLPRNAHILDAGCGSGRDSEAFVQRGFRVTAIDASPAMVKATQRRNIEASVLPFQEMPFSQDFDGIWACASLLHVPHKEMPDVLNRFARALKPHGILYVSLKEGHGERVAEDGRFFSYFDDEEFSKLLTRKGLFKIVEAWKNIDPDSSGTVRPWLNFLAQKAG